MTEQTLGAAAAGIPNDIPSSEFNNPSNFSNLWDFHKRALSWTCFQNEKVTEVCYGGTFAVPAYRIIEVAKEPTVRQVMINLERDYDA